MAGSNKYVVVIGIDNILRCGLFHLIEAECIKRNLIPLYSANDHDFWMRIPEQHSGPFNLAILCLGVDDFFPTWLGTFLTLLRKTNGNVLIFTDSHDLLNRPKKNLLARVCELEHILDVSMPVSYLSFLVEYYMSRDCSVRGNCKMSMREIAVIDGFLNGIDAVCHSAWMGITTKTLYQHRKNCANKLGVRNLKELLRL
jgi:hypothetical protein